MKQKNNMDMLFSPKSVAVIGASSTKGKIGHAIMENFVKGKFRGIAYPINPKVKSILGQKAYPSILNIPGPVDLAVIAIPAKFVPPALKECVQKKVKATVIVSSGFSEIGGVGIAREKLCESIIAGSGMRVLGPNCIGVLDAKTGTDTLFLSMDRLGRPKPGRISFISQSGAVGSTILDWLSAEEIGISKFIAYENGMDIDEADSIEYLDNDPETKVIALYIEGVKNGENFIRAARRAKKPIIVLKGGRTKFGSKAAFSHTGRLAGSSAVYSGIFRQCGIIEVDSWRELFNLAKGFAFQQRPKGKRLAIVTDGGGFGVLAADVAEREGLLLPQTSEEMKSLFRKSFPAYATLDNPIDITGDTNAERYKIAIEACLKSNRYDGVLAITLFQVPTLEENIVDVVAALSEKYPKPILCCAAGGEFTRNLAMKLEAKNVPVYQTPKEAIEVFSAMARN
jgi:acetyl coenzyme A synthetase (ADP forming)-like protein